MDRDGDRRDGRAAQRQPYERPSIAWEEPMLARPAIAMACAKTDATAGSGCEFSAPAS